MSEIIADRLAQLPSIQLFHGSHEPGDQMCAMEMAAWLVDEPWSDHPECVCPVIGAFMRSWNDGLADDERTTLLLPLIPRLINTRGSKDLEQRRATMAADWLIRVHTPAWLRLAKLYKQADAMAALPEITDFAQCPSLMPTLAAARDAAWSAGRDAARDAAWSAAWDAARADARAAARDAARDAAWSTAWCAARDAAGSAAWDAAWDAARDAARDAAWSAAWSAARAVLKATKEELQLSAVDLVGCMIAVRD